MVVLEALTAQALIALISKIVVSLAQIIGKEQDMTENQRQRDQDAEKIRSARERESLLYNEQQKREMVEREMLDRRAREQTAMEELITHKRVMERQTLHRRLAYVLNVATLGMLLLPDRVEMAIVTAAVNLVAAVIAIIAVVQIKTAMREAEAILNVVNTTSAAMEVEQMRIIASQCI
jgi:hypothetical protein